MLNYRNSENRLYWLVLLLILLLIAVITPIRFHPDEDAAILFRYAENLSNTGVISYNPNGEKVEGATDFLWMVTIAGLHKLGLPQFPSSLLLAIVSLYLTIVILSKEKIKDSLVLLLIFFTTPFLWAGLGGFSNITFGLTFLMCLKAYNEKHIKPFYFLILIFCLIRPDGIIFSAPLFLFSLYRFRDSLALSLTYALTFLILPGTLYFFARYNYFEELLPLSFYVKSSASRGEIIDLTFIYQNLLLITALSPFIASIMNVSRKDSYQKLEFIACILFPVLILSFFTPDQNIGMRFQYPLFIFILYNYIRMNNALKPGWRTIWLIAFLLIPTTSTLLNVLNRPYETVVPIAHSIKPHLDGNEILLTTESGKLPLYSGINTVDAWGLNTPSYSKRNITSKDIVLIDPDIVVFHNKNNDYDFFNSTHKRDQKSWGSMVSTIYSSLDKNKYSVHFVPFLRNESSFSRSMKSVSNWVSSFFHNHHIRIAYKRFDVYMIKKSHERHEELIDTLQAFGAIEESKFMKEKHEDFNILKAYMLLRHAI